jgi:cobaltochelatase CobT
VSTSSAQVRQQQRVEELCGGAIRALAGEPTLHFRGGRLHRGTTPLPTRAAHLRPTTAEDFGSFRGAADGLALRAAHSDPDLHASLASHAPTDDEAARLLVDLLEQFRVESLATLPGVVANLRHRHETWSRAFHASGLTETASGILLYTVVQVCRSRVTGQPVVEETEDLLEATRFGLVPVIGGDLAGLRRHRADQAAYAGHAWAIASHVASLLTEHEQAAGERRTGSRELFSLFVEGDQDDAVATAVSGESRVLADSAAGYRVFTTVHDREHDVRRLVRASLLEEYRQVLDRRVAAQGVNIPRLARQLRALLAAPVGDGWDDAQEEGVVDGRSLALLVTSPTERRLFRTVRETPVPDSLVTFLVDCSGSMRRHKESLAMVVDVFSRALDLAGVTHEVLGFTTGAWNGGRALKDWRRAGRPPHPGRLNERVHLVFKDAETSWRRGRRGIAGLLKDDLYREGIDGEAVSWACRRMDGRTETRRTLVVVSDGSPMDSATHLANDQHYLDHHLREVVEREERAGSTRIVGLGVGLDLSPFYARSQVVDLGESTGCRVFAEILDLFAR